MNIKPITSILQAPRSPIKTTNRCPRCGLNWNKVDWLTCNKKNCIKK